MHGTRQDLSRTIRQLIKLHFPRIEPEIGNDPGTLTGHGANHPHRVRGLALVRRGDLHKRHLYRLADNTTIGSRVEILETHRSAELRETDQRHKRRLAAPLRETAHTVVIQPVSVIV